VILGQTPNGLVPLDRFSGAIEILPVLKGFKSAVHRTRFDTPVQGEDR